MDCTDVGTSKAEEPPGWLDESVEDHPVRSRCLWISIWDAPSFTAAVNSAAVDTVVTTAELGSCCMRLGSGSPWKRSCACRSWACTHEHCIRAHRTPHGMAILRLVCMQARDVAECVVARVAVLVLCEYSVCAVYGVALAALSSSTHHHTLPGFWYDRDFSEHTRTKQEESKSWSSVQL